MNDPSEDEPAQKAFIQCEQQNTRQREAVERDSDSKARPPDLRLATEIQSLYLAGPRLKVDLLFDHLQEVKKIYTTAALVMCVCHGKH
ncbi:hypothetical protein N7494_005146 [Penicillium frequentans]|uniref:Uncharacterized protein n=1 Tax=Penicillium frequentans TaxID=3151616 RepID=A0AAD6CYV4_9EURO|nr:hypothetical protein N7494_005146 [Penicillium glabrum]